MNKSRDIVQIHLDLTTPELRSSLSQSWMGLFQMGSISPRFKTVSQCEVIRKDSVHRRGEDAADSLISSRYLGQGRIQSAM